MIDLNTTRTDFPILSRTTASGAPLAYLDNAASTQRPVAVIEAMDDVYRRFYSNVHRGIHTLSEEATDAYEQARKTLARFIHAASEREVIFTAGTTAGINTVARAWADANMGAGDVVLLPISEHHANIVPWHQWAERTGGRVEFIPLDADDRISLESLKNALATHQPKMLAFAAAGNVLGTELPVELWTAAARQCGAAVLVDAAQAAPHRSIDVTAWDADFVVFSGHKMCGPSGIGVLYGRQDVLEAMPPFLGGGGMIQRVTTTGFTSHELPEKFEAGTPPIVEAVGLAAAADYLCDVGLDRVQAHEHALAKHTFEALERIDGIRVIGPKDLESRNGILSFVVDGVHAHDVAQFLDTNGVAVRAGHHCTMPLHKAMRISATSRASYYFYNTLEEADRFIEAVTEVKAKFARSGRTRRRRPAPESPST